MTWWGVIWRALLAAGAAFTVGWLVGLIICWWLAANAMSWLIGP